ncbi:hypothetical protein OAF85_00720 [Planctomycetota bacterium]|nr:hypothetical protein [Planctomycetota bacterium]
MALQAHLELLWPDGVPDGTVLNLWRSDTKQSLGLHRLEDIVRAWPATEATLKPGASLFLSSAALAPEAVGGARRGRAADVRAIPGLWADVDLLHPAHKREDLPTGAEWLKAREVLAEYGLDIYEQWSSPGGRYAWLLLEPGDGEIEDDGDRRQLERLLRRFQAAIRGALRHVTGEARNVDPTADLTRVLRPCGAQNRKPDYVRENGGTPPRVRVERPSRVRYSLSELEEILDLLDDAGLLLENGGFSAPFEGELPKEVAPWLAEATKGLVHQVKHEGDRVSALVLEECPACGRGARDGHPAHVSPLAGVLRCKRASCGANDGDGGYPFEKWGPLAITEQARLASIEDLRRRRASVVPSDDEPVATRELVGQAVKEALEGRRGVVAVASPTGSGKTRSHVLASLEPDPFERTRVFAFQTGALINEALVKRSELAPDAIAPTIRRGVQKACLNDRVKELGLEESARSHYCRAPQTKTDKKGATYRVGCEFFEHCEATSPIEPGDVVYTTHAAALHMVKRREINGAVLIFDEAPEVLQVDQVLKRAIEDALESAERLAHRRLGATLQRVARVLLSVIARLGERWDGEGHAPHVGGDELAKLILEGDEEVVRERCAVIQQAALLVCGTALHQLTRVRIYELTQEELSSFRVPHRRRMEPIYLALWRLLHDQGVPFIGAWDGLFEATPGAKERDKKVEQTLVERTEGLDLVMGPGKGLAEGFATVRRLERIRLDRLDRVVVLSANARTWVPRFRAAHPGAPVELKAYRSPTGGLEVYRYAHGSTSRRDTLGPEGLLKAKPGREVCRLVETCAGAVRELRDAVGRRHGEEHARQVFGSRSGLLTYKAALAQLFKLEGEEAEKYDPRQAQALRDRTALSFDVSGYWFGSDTGTNAFEGCRIQVILGDPTPHVGALKHDARVLGLDADELRTNLEAERWCQAIGRTRLEWGEERGIVLVVGARDIDLGPTVDLPAAAKPAPVLEAIEEADSIGLPLVPTLIAGSMGVNGSYYEVPLVRPKDPPQREVVKRVRKQVASRSDAHERVRVEPRLPHSPRAVGAWLPVGWTSEEGCVWAKGVRAGQPPTTAIDRVRELRRRELKAMLAVRSIVACWPPPSPIRFIDIGPRVTWSDLGGLTLADLGDPRIVHGWDDHEERRRLASGLGGTR